MTQKQNLVIMDWVSADGQGSYPGEPVEDCPQAILAKATDFLIVLLDQCTEESDREGILAGHFLAHGQKLQCRYVYEILNFNNSL